MTLTRSVPDKLSDNFSLDISIISKRCPNEKDKILKKF